MKVLTCCTFSFMGLQQKTKFSTSQLHQPSYTLSQKKTQTTRRRTWSNQLHTSATTSSIIDTTKPHNDTASSKSTGSHTTSQRERIKRRISSNTTSQKSKIKENKGRNRRHQCFHRQPPQPLLPLPLATFIQTEHSNL